MRASAVRHGLVDVLVSGGRWLVWRPRRLLLAVVVLGVVWIVSAALHQGDEQSPGPASESTTTAPETSNMPAGWESWPSVTATHHPADGKSP